MEKVRTSLYLPKSLDERVRAKAKQERRTIAACFEILLERALEQEERTKDKP